MTGAKWPLYEELADLFVAEGIDSQFVLMGDGNMHWVTALAHRTGIKTIHVRHEHCAVAAAMGYFIATRRLAVASVTCGPGVTQITTALAAAARARIPMVVFAGESPLNARYYNQAIEQAPLIAATGARYIAAHSMVRMHQFVCEAFHAARIERRPVVLGIPYDLQKLEFKKDRPYQTSLAMMPPHTRVRPDPDQIAAAVTRLADARVPIIIGGRGVMQAGARQALIDLADASGALLANTLPGRGMFDDHPYSLGVAGGYASAAARDAFAAADLVLAFGASLAYQVSDGGALFPDAHVIQVDTEPMGLRDGLRAAHQFVVADAQLAAEAMTGAIQARGGRTAAVARKPALAERLKTEPADSTVFDVADDVLDPRAVIATLDAIIPKDWDIVSGSGHQAYFNSQMRGRSPSNYHVIREFGAIGNGLSFAMGVAAARGHGKVVLIDGDGGLLMHIQELETLRRHGLRILLCVLNDGAYGSEIHKLRADGVDESGAVFGRPAFQDVARAFGLRGVEFRNVSTMASAFRDFEQQPLAEVWNIQISDQVTAPVMRKLITRGHGVL
jgi:thiamine pyrophosphate-dependent acetolactate synthase large subunit-like protein